MTILDELAEHFGLGHSDVARIVQTAPARYKTYEIPKRRGGTRIIAQPSKELKGFQRYVIQNKLLSYPVHGAATAYAPGRSILRNATVHARSRVILKLDFESFFTSIRAVDFARFVRARPEGQVPPSELPSYMRLLFWGVIRHSKLPVCLSIGAPSSPIISNILLYQFDQAATAVAAQHEVIYTRYADDITASGGTIEAVLAFERSLTRLVRDTKTPKLKFNEEKRGLYLRGQRRMVTGLTITPQGAISIGRERKRLVSSMLHHAKDGRLDREDLLKLKGWLGFAIGNEPAFVSRLREKYGSEIVRTVLQFESNGGA